MQEGNSSMEIQENSKNSNVAGAVGQPRLAL